MELPHIRVTLLLLGFQSAYLAFPLGKSPEKPQTLRFSGLWVGNFSQSLSASLTFNLSTVSLLYLDCADP